MTTSHVCVDFTIAPSGKLILNGCIAICTLSIFNPSITNKEVAPVSATACVAANDIVVAVFAMMALVMTCRNIIVYDDIIMVGVQSLININ